MAKSPKLLAVIVLLAGLVVLAMAGGAQLGGIQHGGIQLDGGAAAPAGAAGVANPSQLTEVEASRLPAEARQTLALIAKSGPYPYAQDGVNFGNFEGILPRKSSGYYKEYTVRTPGEPDRGARRIVAGNSGEKYYTGDHYSSFRFIIEGK